MRTLFAVHCIVAVVASHVIGDSAEAITISTAEIAKGAVQVRGQEVRPLAFITWEGNPVAQATGHGRFRFATANVPHDCVGELSDGHDTKLVVIQGCGPRGPQGMQGPPGQNCGFCPTPVPTATPGSGGCGDSEQGTITTITLPGSDLDIGWTGIAHNSLGIHDVHLTSNLDCGTGTICKDGAGTSVGAPLPLSAGGVSSCVVNEFREVVTGTYDCGTNCSTSSVQVISRVYLVIDQDKPCPPCIGDANPNDGQKGGTCDGGASDGNPCDVGGISDLFQNAGGTPPDAGRTSNDCLPSGSPVGRLNIDLNPLTTGTVSQTASVNCLSSAFPPGSCFCPGQVQPNACIPNGVCPASGFCEQNPPDGVCSSQPFRSCILSNPPQADCEDIAPGSGACTAQPRPCFGNTISRTGICGTEEGTLVSIFCIPATNAPAVNTVYGLPGPGAVALPIKRQISP